nr:reverse transcriptase domain-containing protein [Tanacetum cinerariifolium]
MDTNGNGDDVPPPNGGGDLPVPDLQTMEELCQPTLNGQGGPIAPGMMLASILTNSCMSPKASKSESSSSITSSFDPEIVALKAEMAEINKNLMKVLQINQQVKVVTHSCETCGGLHSYNDCIATIGQTQNINTASSSGLRTLPSNTITNPKEDLKGIATRSGNAYQGPTIPTTSSPPKVVQRETEVTKDTVPPTNNESTKDVQPSAVQVETQIANSEPVVAPVVEPVEAPTGRALIDAYEGELTLRVGNKAITFNLDQSLRYSANYDVMSINRIDVIDVDSEEDSDFLLEETDAFLAIDIEPISSKIDDSYYDSEGDILLLEEFLNDDPSSPPLPPQELKDLPPHLEYAFLEGDDKLPVIIAKDLKDEQKTTLIKVLKSHKQVLAWQLSDIKGITLEFCTHKILMEDDFKPVVQHQRRVNPKIHEVIKKEVLKLLDAELLYPISDSPWMCPMHCVPKKGGLPLLKMKKTS